MTPEMEQRAKSIAEGLTEAQRRVIGRSDRFNVTYADMRVLPALNKKGLITRAPDSEAMQLTGQHVYLNVLGLAVRDLLRAGEGRE